MKVGMTIRADMGEGHVIKDSFELIKFLENSKDLVDFIEIYCTYPLPLNLNKGLSELQRFLKDNKIEVGMHFPVEHHDRWLLKKNFNKVVDILCKFAEKVNAVYMNIHPGDLTYFLDSTNRDEILEGLYKIKEKAPCKIVVENGITILERAEDLNFFSKNGILIDVDICHLHEAGLPFEMFSKEFKSWGNKLFLFHVSNLYEKKPHVELGKGKIKYKHILKKIKNTNAYGICVETINIVEDEIIVRNPEVSSINSLKFLQYLRK